MVQGRRRLGVTEDTVNDLMSQYLRDSGLEVLGQQTTPFQLRIKKPDFWLRDGGIYLGEGEWETKKWLGLAQARDYSETPEAAGSFLIAYPEILRNRISQSRLVTVKPEVLLSGVKYSVVFLTRGHPAALKGGLELKELSEWLRSMVYKTVPPEVEISELISVLRQGAQALTEELRSSTNTTLFRNLLSGDPTARALSNCWQNGWRPEVGGCSFTNS